MLPTPCVVRKHHKLCTPAPAQPGPATERRFQTQCSAADRHMAYKWHTIVYDILYYIYTIYIYILYYIFYIYGILRPLPATVGTPQKAYRDQPKSRCDRPGKDVAVTGTQERPPPLVGIAPPVAVCTWSRVTKFWVSP